MIKGIIRFFDKLEDKVRGKLSHVPIFYALVGGVGVVLFWRGVWHTVDFLMEWYFLGPADPALSPTLPWWDGLLSIGVGSAMLLMAGVFVSNFIGTGIIISGIKGEKKLTERTESEIVEELGEMAHIEKQISAIEKKLEEIEEKIEK